MSSEEFPADSGDDDDDDDDLFGDDSSLPDECLDGDEPPLWYDGRPSRLVRIVKERNELGWHRKEGLATIVKAGKEATLR